MSLLKKKPDPISDRAQLLTSQIAALEAQIKQLDKQLHKGAPQPRLRSTAVPHGATISHHISEPETVTSSTITSPVASQSPVFEPVNREPLTSPVTNNLVPAPELYNELGVRKYDLPALIQRVRDFFKGPNASNPRLVNYLAAGGVQGLRPLRKEKRVARNRFFALVVFFFLMLFGIVYWFFNHM